MANDQPRPGHKYRSRRRQGSRWIYDYGDGAPRPRRGASQDPPPGALVMRPGQPPSPAVQAPVSTPEITRQDVANALAGAGMADIRAALGRRPGPQKLKALAAEAASRITEGDRVDPEIHPAVKFIYDEPKRRRRRGFFFVPHSISDHEGTRHLTDADYASAEAAVNDLSERINNGASLENLVPDKKADGVVAPPRIPLAIRPPGDKETLKKQVDSIHSWTSAGLNKSLAKFTSETGFVVAATSPGGRVGGKRLKAAKETAITLLALRHLVHVDLDMAQGVRINVIAKTVNAHATYQHAYNVRRAFRVGPRQVQVLNQRVKQPIITIHDRAGGHSTMHEFGHYLDHKLGLLSENDGFASSGYAPDSQRDGITIGRPNAMTEFVREARKTASAAVWKRMFSLSSSGRRHLAYLEQPHEIVARFFDCWAHWQLGRRGYDTEALMTRPGYNFSGFSDDDIKTLAPLFEKALGAHLVKSLLRALEDLAWIAKGRARPLLA